MKPNIKILRVGLLAAMVPAAVACSNLLEVDAPGRIADSDLNNKNMIHGLVVGMSYDLMQAYNSSLQTISIADGELFHGGSYDFADIPQGIILPEDVNGEWGSMQQARWVAEDGVQRRIPELLDESAYNKSEDVAAGYLYAGLANRLLGENLCATAIDGGEEQPNTVHFDRAVEDFTKAIQIGQAAGAQNVVNAAYGGRASVKAWTGDWSGAVQDAQQVPADFEWDIVFSQENRNDLKYETHNRFEFTVWNTMFADHPNDPRVPWDTIFNNDGSIANGANGASPMYQQEKYVEDGSDIPAVKGTEMLVLRAEAALRNNDIGGAYDLMNQARAVYGMDPLTPASDMQGAWDDLHYERSATVWLEARHFWDARRWYAASGPEHYDFLDGRDKCIPISREERRSNPNLSAG